MWRWPDARSGPVQVTLWWASANRDEDGSTSRSRSTSAGRQSSPGLRLYRSHFCLGANLARMEIRIMLEETLERFVAFRLDGPIERSGRISMPG